MSVSDEEMIVVRAIKQAFEMYATNGGAVQANNNPFFVTANGEFDLLKTAKVVLAGVNSHRERTAQLLKDEAARHLANAKKEIDEASSQQDSNKWLDGVPQV